MTDEATLRDYADVNARACDMPLDVMREALTGSDLLKRRGHAFVAYRDDASVSAAMTVENGGCLFLALVATVPDAPGKGFGAATVREALHQGARATGLTRTVLHAKEAGLPPYRRLGYGRVATISACELAD